MVQSTNPDSAADAWIPIISAQDPDILDLFPAGFDLLYEVHSYRNAARILATACTDEFREIVDTLMAFRVPTAHIVVGGGNKSKIALAMEERLKPLEWLETRIVGDLQIRRISRVSPPPGIRKKGRTQREDLYRIPGFVDGHKIDFVKGRVAFDMEWNSKDQTFDRDLYALRAFYECNVITAGVLLTRSAELVPLFREISSRVDIPKFGSKFGASTTWMQKLTYRLDAGRAGGCPVLAIGIKPAVVSDYDDWRAAHPIQRTAASLQIDGEPEDPDD